jgi:hypothetical protein
MHDDSEIIEKIRQRIGKEVSFNYPGDDEDDKHGVLKDRAVIRSNSRTKGIPYWDVVDLIVFPHEREREWIRIGYYRRPTTTDRLVWASQTTITEPVGTWKRILSQAAREKAWFRELLEEVVDEIRK